MICQDLVNAIINIKKLMRYINNDMSFTMEI